MNKQAANADPGPRPIDRILAFSALGLTVLSIMSFFAIMIGSAAGMTQATFSSGIWPVVALVPMFALPVAFLLILWLLIASVVRKARAQRG